MRGARWIVSLALAVAVAGSLVSCGGSGGGNFSSSAVVTFLTNTLPDGVTGQPYSAQFEANFPHPAGNYLVISGTLPPGLVVDGASGEISGFPRRVGTFHFEVAARDGVDVDLIKNGIIRDVTYGEDHKTFEVTVTRGLPNILSTFLPAAQYRASYDAFIDVAGGVPPYTFAEVAADGSPLPPGTSNLPAGLSVAANGEVGTFPTQGRAAPYVFTAKVTDANGDTDVQDISISVIVKPLTIATAATLPDAGRDFPYDVAMALASPGGGAPYAWTQVTPAQPGDTPAAVPLSGIRMEISPDGHLRNQSGFTGPSPEGTFTFTLQVQDVAGQVTTRQFTMTVIHFFPSITSITPNRANAPGPWTVTGANFLITATLTFGVGLPGETTITPSYVNQSTLRFTTSPTVVGAAGPVDVRVNNGNGDTFTKPKAFLYPATNLAFNLIGGFVSSNVSSFGLDCADVDNDGKADVVHCGVAGFQSFTTYTSADGWAQSSAGGLLYHHATGSPGSPSFSTQTLDSGNWYDVKFADVNVDGRIDIVALGATSVKTWLNGVNGNPVGTFSAGPSSTLPAGFSYPSQMAIGFFDNDSIPDIAFGVAHYSNTSGQVHKMAGNGSGGFTSLASATTTLSGTYGVNVVACLDMNGDGRSDVLAGQGVGLATGPWARYSITSASGLFGGWTNMSTSPLYYPNTLGIATGDFLGTGTPAAVFAQTEDPDDGGQRELIMYSGATLSSPTVIVGQSSGLAMKDAKAFDGDFDAKIDLAVTVGNGRTNANSNGYALQNSYLDIWRGSAITINLYQLDPLQIPGMGSWSPRLGRIASGDIDGDGKADILATSSYWTFDYQPMIYGGGYSNRVNGDGGQKGFCYWLNTSN